MNIENLIVVAIAIISGASNLLFYFFKKNDNRQDIDLAKIEAKFNKDLKELKDEMSKGFEEIKSSLSAIKEFIIKQNFKNESLDKLQLKVEKLEADVNELKHKFDLLSQNCRNIREENS